MSLDYLRPSTWLTRVRHLAPWKSTTNPHEVLLMADEFYERVAKLRPRIQEESGKLACKLGVPLTAIEDIPPVEELFTSKGAQGIIDKLVDFYTLRQDLLATTGEQLMPDMYSYNERCGDLRMRAPCRTEITEEQGQSREVVTTLMNELNFTQACISEAERWLKDHDSETRQVYQHIWRCMSLGVVITQCLQMTYAYWDYITQGNHPDGVVHVGIATPERPRRIDVYMDRIHPAC